MNKKTRSTKSTRKAAPEQGPDSCPGYLEIGRVNQKRRTRDALVSVATEFIKKGHAVSVSEIADAAKVSRTTAYRYFPTSEMLFAQATVLIASSIDSDHLAEIADGPGSANEKLDAIIKGSDAMTAAHESAFRTFLRVSVEAGLKRDPGTQPRPAVRRQWLESALADLRKGLGSSKYHRLTGVLSLFCGVESFVVLQDICSMTPGEALVAKRWAAQKLLAAAIEESTGGDRISRRLTK